MVSTTIPVATMLAEAAGIPKDTNHMAMGAAKAASPTIPFKTPMEVMPIWMVDKKRVGSSPNLTAAAAPLSP